MGPRAHRGRFPRLLDGHLPTVPRPLDALCEWWAGRRARVRLLLIAVLLGAVALGVHARVRAAEQRWGGAPVEVLVAAQDLAIGEVPRATRRERLPPAAVPDGALVDLPTGAPLSLAVPRGAVLTDHHFAPAGPSAGLTGGLRALPVPLEDGWGVTAGSWVDVWVLGAGEEPARLVARARPVLHVDGERPPTALVGLSEDEVALATEGIALGRVLLAHAPAPSQDR